MKKTDKQILCKLNHHDAMTEQELSQALGYRTMTRRLKRMIVENLIQYTVISNNSSCKYKLFTDYAGMRLYYTDDDHLRRWLKKNIPSDATAQQKQSITMRVRRDFKIHDFTYTNRGGEI
jgi:hypothetical protein